MSMTFCEMYTRWWLNVQFENLKLTTDLQIFVTLQSRKINLNFLTSIK